MIHKLWISTYVNELQNILVIIKARCVQLYSAYRSQRLITRQKVTLLIIIIK